ncbi:hypothetical protein [Saccharothrix sp. ST-888]|uniref:hypothetical protein n=1 Tax=Saccharothrix sp. ST-888 TaxID=1427391 RepID=UPI0005ECB920|nr:hypothetical protein [Saccharothrix sp. ST-888]KJK56267.1 hypothetical protein UK12_23525 [Saccharothrix sp. ST-888]
MKLSKRAGALLLAAGAGVLATQGAAAAAPVTQSQVADLEDRLAAQEVPFEIPLGTDADQLPLLPEGGRISGGIPISPVMAPVPGKQADRQMFPDEVVPSLTAGKVGPSAQADLPLPVVDRSTRLGDLRVDVPAAPIKAAGPALALGQPVSYVEGNGAVEFGEIKPQLITKPIRTVPGAAVTLGGQDDRVSATEAVERLAATVAGAGTSVLDRTQA